MRGTDLEPENISTVRSLTELYLGRLVSFRNSLDQKLVSVFKNSLRTAKKTLRPSITKTSRSVLFEGTIAVVSGNHSKLVNTLAGQRVELLIISPSGTYSYSWALKC
jgi:hypothetical protein